MMTTKLKIACDYLNADMDGHLKAHGKWRLDPGKLQAALDTSGLTVEAYKAAWALVPREIREKVFDVLHAPETEWIEKAIAAYEA